jgi:pyruvate dehydrogenase E2 component (dihydrolipoamide acetyltransferase)
MEEIFVPASGMAMEDVLFTEWVKEPGDEIAPGEVVAIVETDKSVVELSGTMAGTLSRHLVHVGDRVPGGTTVAYVMGAGETEPGSANSDDVPAGAGGTTAASAPPKPLTPEVTTLDGKHRLSPRQRRQMAEATSAAAVESGQAEPNRRATAALVSQSWRDIPHFSVGRDVRVDGLLETVARKKASGLAVTVTDFLLLGLSRALVAVGEAPDVGLAVATEWGVLVPVLSPLAGAALGDVSRLREAAVGRARARRLGTTDSAGVFATLSNLGTAGVGWFTGIVPVGQVALLTVGEVALRPAVEDGGLVVAPMLTAIVTADHRQYDGVGSARLLAQFVGELATAVRENQP